MKCLKILFLIFLTFSCSKVPESGVEGGKNDNQETGNQENPELPLAEDSYHWWPLQKEPSSVVICNFVNNNVPDHMLAQSLAGLAALGVNEDRFDEMVWMSRNDADSKLWYEHMMAEKGYISAGTFTTWELLDRYVEKGLVKGYVLYRQYSKGSESANLATTLASIHQSVLIEEELEAKAQKLGLKKMADATTSSEKGVFNEFKEKLNRKLLITIEPKLPNLRDFAIANKAMCVYGMDEFEKKVMEWLTPFSPIFGWNAGDEFLKTALPTYYGHFVVPSSLSYNLPIISAGSETVSIEQTHVLDPREIKYDDINSYHSFIMSDGDNYRYTTSNFYTNREYWGNAFNKTIPMTWAFCPLNMAMGNPYAWNEIIRDSDAPNVFEFGGGYHYPDLFANSRTNKEELQREFAKMLNIHFKKMGIKVFGFICKDRKSASAMRAYKIFAEEIEGLTGMLAVQYNPYEDGKGEIMWVKNRDGISIPVLCPKYSLWANVKAQYKGNPDKISSLINQDLINGQNFNATMVHAWSHYIKNPDGSVSDANNTDAAAVAGVEPVQWTKEKLNDKVKVVTLEELLWRIRMKYREEETKKVLGIN